MSAAVPVSPATMAAVPPPSVTSPSTISISDERDVFISWLRAEFAAANAIIDLLLSHLMLNGVPGEYDHVAASLQQRRAHWVPLIHLQQYFPVAEVAMALQHSAWRRQHGTGPAPLVTPQQQSSQALPRGGRKYGMNNGTSYGHGNDHGSGYNNGSGFNNSRRYSNNNRWDSGTRENVSVSCGGSSEEVSSAVSEANNESKERERETLFEYENCMSTVTDENHAASHKDGSSKFGAEIPSNTKRKTIVPKEFVINERIDGARMVNVLDGLKIYEELVERSEAKMILSWVYETRDKGRHGELQGQTFIATKPSKGHGRQIIQLGVPVIEGSFDEEHTPGISREKVEAVPGVVQNMLEQLVHRQVVPFKPDYCIIDFFNEGDYSQPSIWPSYYGSPVCTLCLTECDMVFGRFITSDYRGNQKGPLKLSLSPGDLVVLRSKGDEMVRRAVPSMRKERVFLTFGKSQPRRNHSVTSNSASSAPLQWSPNPSAQSFNQLPRHNTNPKHYGFVPTLPEAAQPILVPAPQIVTPVPVAVPLAAPVTTPLTQAAPHPIVPGTGVFLLPPPPPHSMNGLQEYFQASGEPVNS